MSFYLFMVYLSLSLLLLSVLNAVDSNNSLRIDHDYLASSYHSGIISGLMLISSYLREMVAKGGKVMKLFILEPLKNL